ncbi:MULTISPECIES: hypothetical protein [Methylocaldum]|jgi:hypothetical protein|uniref:hypothetical protein n=1 Tax=unclassified Methylocaldum TaxID=2622260 RepID=UPI00098A737C|nr:MULTISPECIES: hypothetical protein [unclassified Methylocaldum]MBP1151381.1 hypothetical protein [Methylocaldum sp. RMAD-M]MDV3241356.1 hypothetical protein [Methylocaldum sp.]MVF23872.1 hypothetical protein [Methylocaldum sp. BRCS4]
MNTITVRTDGARVGGIWYDAGCYRAPLHAQFEGPGYYWLEPVADHHGVRYFEKGISLGACDTQAQLDSAIDVVIREHGEMTDSIWLLGATTAISITVETFDR